MFRLIYLRNALWANLNSLLFNSFWDLNRGGVGFFNLCRGKPINGFFPTLKIVLVILNILNEVEVILIVMNVSPETNEVVYVVEILILDYEVLILLFYLIVLWCHNVFRNVFVK